MTPRPDRRSQSLRHVAVSACALTALLIVAGCATAPSTAGRDAAVSEAEPQRAESAARASRERSRRDYPEIETDESGFTITEQLRISGEARADYQAALQMLRQERYEQGIAMLLEITEIVKPDSSVSISG